MLCSSNSLSAASVHATYVAKHLPLRATLHCFGSYHPSSSLLLITNMAVTGGEGQVCRDEAA